MNVVDSNSSDVPLYVQIKEQIKDARCSRKTFRH